MGAEALSHHGTHIELLTLARSGAVDDDTPEWAAAPETFGGVLAAELLEDGVHAFALSEFLHALLVIDLFVIDEMVQSQLLRARKLFVR